jgi:hypothetical protein
LLVIVWYPLKRRLAARKAAQAQEHDSDST